MKKPRRMIYINQVRQMVAPEELDDLDNDLDLPEGVDLYKEIVIRDVPTDLRPGDAIVQEIEEDHERKERRLITRAIRKQESPAIVELQEQLQELREEVRALRKAVGKNKGTE